MSTTSTSSRRAIASLLPLFAVFLLAACGKKAEPNPNTQQATQPAPAAPAISSPDEPPAPSNDIMLPKAFGRRTGDLDEMAKGRNIRALVLLNPIGFFYDKGQPRGPKAMSDAAAKPMLQAGSGTTRVPAEVSIGQIFLEFLIIGATSFGGVVPYLRGSLVTKRHWIDDKEFVEMLSISQSLPGLNATNMAVLVGEKLRGALGSIAGIIGVCVPGGILMFAVGIFYHHHGDHVWITAALKGVAAAAVDLILSTVVGPSKKSLAGRFDFVFMALTVIAVNRLHLGVPRTLIGVGILAILFHYPRKQQKESVAQ